MKNFVISMLQYLQDRNVKDITQYHIASEDKQAFNTLVIELLGWLKLEHKRDLWKKEKKYAKNKPLKLNMNYPWCQILNALVKQDENFSKYFIINDGQFEFNESVDDKEKEVARKLAFDNYNPKLMR